MSKSSLRHPPIMHEPHGPIASARRIAAMIERYIYLIRGSWVRIVELIYWPLLQMLMWGFMQLYLAQTSSLFAQAGGLLIGAVLLWDILFRAQIGFSICFLEEMWARNLGQLLLSPLRANEFLVALSVMSLIRLAIGLVPVILLAYYMFDFNLFGFGLALGAFFANLVFTSWSLALCSSGIIMRYGLGAEEFAWSLAFIMLPLCCVYYPVATLPDWLQPVALALPPTHVFEGMRGLVLDGVFDSGAMWRALSLNAVFVVLGYGAFRFFLRSTRINGSLLTQGE
jgi:ABC-2 type transport system permease protein